MTHTHDNSRRSGAFAKTPVQSRKTGAAVKVSCTSSALLRSPQPADAARIWHLLGRIRNLERNSCYAYLLLCSHFSDTCLVAEHADDLVGFVLGYRLPADERSLFVWQVGVAPERRGTGLGHRLLASLIQQPACSGVERVCATVSRDNTASLALFHGFARRLDVACQRLPGFGAALFARPHPDEDLLRIGPLKGRA